MLIRSALTATIAVLMAGSAHGIEAHLPRHPAPSPDGATIALSWQGDLWLVPSTGGAARRLTAHPANERFPVWSRDGRLIAFASDRHGSLDVFVMPADGSAGPRRLTHTSVTDIPVDFTPDGSAVLFESRRAEGVRRIPSLYTVPVEGGTPALAQSACGRSARYSPDGETLVFVRGGTPEWRRGYRGSGNRDLWTASGGAFHRITDFDGDDDFPSWVADDRLCLLSARSGRKNVFLLSLGTGEASQITFHDGSDVRRPRAAGDGSIIAYEFEDGIWTVTPAKGAEPRRLVIDVAPDLIHNPVDWRSDSKSAEDLTISADGTLAAFVVHGDIFVTEITSKEDQEVAAPATVRVTATPEREQDPEFSPDGRSLVYASARQGSLDLYRTAPTNEDTPWVDTFDFVAVRLTDDAGDERSPRFSPDGTRLAFVANRGDLVVADADGRNRRTLVEHWDPPDFRWSPDGRWLAYSIEDMNANAEVWIVSADGGSPYNVSRHPDYDVAPRFSPDGRRLVWLSRRHADTFDVWGVWLARADDERSPNDWLKLWKSQEGAPAPPGDGGAAEKDEAEAASASEQPTVTIDFDRLWERGHAITSLLGDEGPALVSPDGRTVVFTAEHQAERDLYKVRWDGEEVERLTTGDEDPSDVQFDKAGTTLFYLDGKGVIRRVGLDGTAGDSVPFVARYDVVHSELRRVVFDDAWQALDHHFYDPSFHGVDWAAVHDAYRPWALAASTDEDFADVVNMMFGELNASHLGYIDLSDSEDGEATGFLGAFFDPAAGGPGLQVREVLPDSPADRLDVQLTPGDRVVAINGEELTRTADVDALLVGTVGQRTLLRIRSANDAERTAVVVPISYGELRELRYREWVRERRRLVDQWSGGRLGYIHIQGMDMPSFEEFERSLFAAADGREGLLIDVRFNGGGSTTDYLMAVLMVQRHAYTVPRGADPTQRAYPTAERLPLAAWTRPAVTLCNEESYSNAEIFPYAFSTLGRGKVVGVPTFGAVISTGATTMLNGAIVRLPMRGWYVAPTGQNMENNGMVPDVIVEQPPEEDLSAVDDSQLRRAVDVLLHDLDEDPRAGAW
jgi:tricorn protease